jgi:site-specific DNA-methyltransferase (adenine-specific)
MLQINKIHQGDCLEVMTLIDAKSIDMILCDLPYGSTECKWDTMIAFDELWSQYKRVIAATGAIVLTASQPFTSALVMSNPAWYKHHWIWVKERGTGFQCARYRPMMKTEDIIMFRKSSGTYNPQMVERETPLKYNYPSIKSKSNPLMGKYISNSVISTHKYPENTLYFNTERGQHPTQKPVALFEYLIKTYTNEGDLVLDNCAGSGTAGVACLNTKRNFILIEHDEHYCEVARVRIANTKLQK